MDIIFLIINIIVMVATIISTVVAVRAKEKSIQIFAEISQIDNSLKKTEITLDDVAIKNSGDNTGVIAQNVSGGVKFGK